MGFLSQSEKATLALICQTLIPSLEPNESDAESLYRFSATDHNVVDIVEATIQDTTSESDQFQLKLVLRAFENGLYNGMTVGQWDTLSTMPFEVREQVLYKYASSRLALKRKVFQGIKKLALFIHYSNPPNGQQNPTWHDLGYTGSPGPAKDTPRTITPLSIHADTVLETDVLIIGSGAGGGVVAGELTEVGLDVIIAEKGGYYAEADFHGNEMHANNELYEKKGALTTADTAMMVLAGSSLGGGTTINWSASFRTPDHVLQEWEQEYGFSGATSDTLQKSFDAVMARTNVNMEESYANGTNHMLEKGCAALDYNIEVIPRNVKGCEECGFCNYGCAFGAKQGTLKTYLQDAYDLGARIIVRANVTRILHKRRQVDGAKMVVSTSDGHRYEVTVRAKAVIVAAGSIHTPPLLKRSGLENPNIGANLRLHPVTAIFSIFDEPINAWQGPPLTRVSKQFTNLDGKGYGVALETAPAHPGIAAATLPWTSSRQHKQLMERAGHMANIIVITRDFYGGEVKTDRNGNPILDYKVHPYDRAHMQKGVIEALRIHKAAGAKQIFGPHNEMIYYDNSGSNGHFEHFLQEVEARGLKPNESPLFSAHQMSSCRIGGDASMGAVDPTGESYEIKNLFVADGSVLPTATGVNPMMSIMATAHYIAQHIKSKIS